MIDQHFQDTGVATHSSNMQCTPLCPFIHCIRARTLLEKI